MEINNKLSFELPPNYGSWLQLYEEAKVKEEADSGGSSTFPMIFTDSSGNLTKINSFDMESLGDNVVQELTSNASSKEDLLTIHDSLIEQHPALAEKVAELIRKRYPNS